MCRCGLVILHYKVENTKAVKIVDNKSHIKYNVMAVAAMAQSVEHILGKDEVTSSSLVSSSIKSHEKIVGFLFVL